MNNKKALPILFAVTFLVMIGFGIVIPVLPFYAKQMGASPTELGWLMAVYSLLQLIFAPFWGRISDRVGRKPVMLAGIVGLSVSFFLMAFSSKLWMLFVARIIGGFLSAANMPTVTAYVADITSHEDRSKGMGLIGAATGLGFIFGPAIGGIFSKTSLETPFYIAGVFSLLTSIFVLFILKESLPSHKDVQQSAKRTSIKEIFNGPILFLFFLQFFIAFSLAGLETTFAYFTAEKAHLNTVKLGYIFMIMGLAQAVVQGGAIGKLTKKFGEGMVIQLGIILSAIGFGLILLLSDFVTASIFITIFGIGNCLIRPSITSLLTKISSAGHGSISGVLSSVDSFGRIVGPPVGGWLYSISIGLPYISGIILSIIAFFLYRIFAHQSKKLSIKSAVN